MSDEVGPMDLHECEDAPFLGRETTQSRVFSEHSAAHVDHAVRALLIEAEARAAAIVRGHTRQLQALVAVLEDKETLDRDEIATCLADAPEPAVLAPESVPSSFDRHSTVD